MNESDQLRKRLLQDSLATLEVRRWLTNLRESRFIHGSKDSHAENAFSKLLDYGLNCANPAFAESAEHLLDYTLQIWDSHVLLPFLVRAGYNDHPRVIELFMNRFEKLQKTVKRGSFDFYLSSEDAAGVPKAWQGKPLYRDEFGHQEGYPLPTCYDFYTLVYCPPKSWIFLLYLRLLFLLSVRRVFSPQWADMDGKKPGDAAMRQDGYSLPVKLLLDWCCF
jgi:hypothetical protein